MSTPGKVTVKLYWANPVEVRKGVYTQKLLTPIGGRYLPVVRVYDLTRGTTTLDGITYRGTVTYIVDDTPFHTAFMAIAYAMLPPAQDTSTGEQASND